MPDYQKLITCMSASKAFNLAGMMMSNIIIRDESLRNIVHSHETCDMNPLSIAAVQAAAVPTKAEATYLAWIDMRNTLPDIRDLPLFFAQKAGVLLEGGDSLFVGNAEGFIRLNLAMPRSMLAEGLERIAMAIENYKKQSVRE